MPSPHQSQLHTAPPRPCTQEHTLPNASQGQACPHNERQPSRPAWAYTSATSGSAVEVSEERPLLSQAALREPPKLSASTQLPPPIGLVSTKQQIGIPTRT